MSVEGDGVENSESSSSKGKSSVISPSAHRGSSLEFNSGETWETWNISAPEDGVENSGLSSRGRSFGI